MLNNLFQEHYQVYILLSKEQHNLSINVFLYYIINKPQDYNNSVSLYGGMVSCFLLATLSLITSVWSINAIKIALIADVKIIQNIQKHLQAM